MSNTDTSHLVSCDNCYWVHFQVSREYAVNQVAEFNAHLSEQDRLTRTSTVEEGYLSCKRCGGSYKHFHDSFDHEVSFGSTINPVLDRNE